MEKQQQILRAALQLFVANGFHGTPTSRIAQEAGVSNGTLFHYFPTKDALIVAVYNWVKDSLNEHLLLSTKGTQSVRARAERVYVSSINWALEHPDEFYYIQQVQFSPQLALVPAEVLQAQARTHYDLIQAGIDQQVLKPLPASLVYTLFSGQVFSVYQYLTTSTLPQTETQSVINQTFSLLWDMLT